MLPSLLTPAERTFRFVVVQAMACASGFASAYYWCEYLGGYRSTLFGIGWGAGWGVMVGMIQLLQSRLYSLDDLERRQMQDEFVLHYNEQQERARLGDLRELQRDFEFTAQYGNTTIIGRIPERWVTYIRSKGKPPSHRNYPALPDEVWHELRRLGLIRDKGAGKHAGVEWTEAGRQWLNL